jgi:hypothetical protein
VIAFPTAMRMSMLKILRTLVIIWAGVAMVSFASARERRVAHPVVVTGPSVVVTGPSVVVTGPPVVVTGPPVVVTGPVVWSGPIGRGCYWYLGQLFCGRYCYTEVNGRHYCRENEWDAVSQAPWSVYTNGWAPPPW